MELAEHTHSCLHFQLRHRSEMLGSALPGYVTLRTKSSATMLFTLQIKRVWLSYVAVCLVSHESTRVHSKHNQLCNTLYQHTISRIHRGLKVVFCFKPATLSHYQHLADLITCIEHMGWKILQACLSSCWVYSVESVFKVKLILSIPFLIFFAICGAVCVILAHSRLGDREDTLTTHLIIIIKSEVSILPIVVIFFRGCVPGVVVPSYAVRFKCILVKLVLFLLLLYNWIMHAMIHARIRYGPIFGFVCFTLHYLIIIIMQTYLKVLNF